jgi:hypothetical protein
METPIVVALIGAAVALFVALAAHRLSLWRERQTARRAANAKFMSVALAQFNGLYPHPTGWPANVEGHLRSIFSALSAAVAEFSLHLSSAEKAAFIEAWRVYRLGHDGREIDQQCYDQYMGFGGMSNPKHRFHLNVSALLSFAERSNRVAGGI